MTTLHALNRTGSNEINWEEIQHILETNGFLKDSSKIRYAVEQMEQYCDDEQIDKESLISSLCDGYSYQHDENNALYDLLSNKLNYKKSTRFKLYDILLHRYITLSELDKTHLVTVLTPIITKIDSNININKFDQIARNNDLDGRSFELSEAASFARLFRAINVDTSIWKRIYKIEIKKWDNKHCKNLFNTKIEEVKEEEDKEEEEEEEAIDNNHECKIEITPSNHLGISSEDTSSSEDDESDLENPMRRSRLLSFNQNIDEIDSNNMIRLQSEEEKQHEEAIKIPHLYKKKEARYRKQDYPVFINKAIWGRSDDEYLELLVDTAILEILNLKACIHHKDATQCRYGWRQRTGNINTNDDEDDDDDDDDDDKQEYDRKESGDRIQCKPIWEDPDLVSQIYDDTTFCKFVNQIYKSCGGNDFFDTFIKSTFEQQMRIFEFQVQTEIKRVLKTEDEIYSELQTMTFEDFVCGPYGNNGYLNAEMFMEGFKNRGLRVKQSKLKAIYNDIDRIRTDQISREEFGKWKESIYSKRDSMRDNRFSKSLNTKHKPWRVYYDRNHHNVYTFYHSKSSKQYKKQPHKITLDSNLCEDSDYKWAMYIGKIPKNVKIEFRRNHNEQPNGYWVTLRKSKKNKDDKKESYSYYGIQDKAIKNIIDEQISIKHLNLIFQLLHHVYLRNIDGRPRNDKINDPLQGYCQQEELQKVSGPDIIFKIKGKEYKLIWWNKKGKYETTAISLINLTKWRERRNKYRDKHKKSIQQQEMREICYMRFNSAPSKVEWQWYDNNASNYKSFTLNFPNIDYEDTDLLEQLECSFLGNVSINFDPNQFNMQFNNCLLPALKENLLRQQIRSSDEFTFRVHHEENGIIAQMEQVGYTHHERSHFERTIKRLIDGTDSLSIYWRDENLFIQRIKKNCQIYSEDQQKFVFAFMIPIAVKIKYIDIEFANQPVLIPLHFRSGTAENNIVTDNVDDSNIINERYSAHYFEGYLIPPNNMQHCANKNYEAKIMNKTKILRKAKARNPPDHIEELFMWLQSDKDYGKHQYTKQEANFLRFAECIRKYVLEYETGDTLKTLWPWYRNSFHAKIECDNAENYNDLIFKYDYLNQWDIIKLLQQLHSSQKAKQKTLERDGIQLQDKKSPIRYKRKFAAKLLLDFAGIERNLNLLRDQLAPLLNNILNNAILTDCDSELDNKACFVSKCNVDEIIEILNDYAFNALGNHYNSKGNECILNEYQSDVINYFVTNKINGNIFCGMKQTHFVSNLLKRINDFINKEQLEEALNILYGIIVNYKPIETKQEKQYLFNNLGEDDTINLMRKIMREEMKLNEGIPNNTTDKIVYLDYLNKNDEEKQEVIMEFTKEFIINNDEFWPQQIEMVNIKFQHKLNPYSKYHLFDEIYHRNLESLDIDRWKLPLFEQFVYFFFIESDKKQYKINTECFQEDQFLYYPIFLESWRDVPKWWTYEHDILLLELALRHGIGNNCKEFEKDLCGERLIKYKIRMKCNEQNVHNDRFYNFKKWILNEMNILHRLKYVTNIIAKNLENPELGGQLTLNSVRISEEIDRPTFETKSQIFTDYQSFSHLNFITNTILLFDYDDKNQLNRLETVVSSSKCCSLNSICCCCDKTANNNNNGHHHQTHISPTTPIYQQLLHGHSTEFDRDSSGLTIASHTGSTYNSYSGDSYWSSLPSQFCLIRKKTQSKSGYGRIIRVNDPFLSRNIDREICETLQSFDLMTYGVPIALFIIDQFKKQKKEAYWKVLRIVMHALPYPVALRALQDPSAIATLRHGDPEILKLVCKSLVNGSNFKPSAALAVAGFFDELSVDDIVLEDTWKNYSNMFENIAYDEINKVESNHLLFTLLNIPLTTHKNSGLVQLALDHKRIEFLNNDRIHSVIQHLFRVGFLAPNQDIMTGTETYLDRFKLVLFHPFKYYFSAQGYHWISGTLFLMYWGFVCIYSYQRQYAIQLTGDYMIELIFWICNMGYITYEIFELLEKGIVGYFNFSQNGQTNILDVFICIFWLTLFPMRMHFVWNKHYFNFENEDDATIAQKLYLLLFGIQLVLLTVRCLTLFSNSPYLGTLLRVIKLMFIEIFKFSLIFSIVLIGVSFGLFFIVYANKCYIDGENIARCADYEIFTLSDTFIYMFQVFIGTSGLESIEEQPIAVLFIIGATFMGTLVLTNLLIALMTTEYEKVKQAAKAEVIFNETELTFDLSQRSRLMPPPLNMIVLVLTLIIDIINFPFAFWKPKSLNVYLYLEFRLFQNIKKCNIWSCCSWKHRKKLKKPAKFKYEKRSNILNMYFVSRVRNLLRCGGHLHNTELPEHQHLKDWKIHHKSCHGVMIMSSRLDQQHAERYAVRGITMTQLMDKYTQQNIDRNDKVLLKQLTINVLFCSYCYKPFMLKELYSELITPFMSLLDFISALTFVLFPIVWIPLISLYGGIAFIQWIMKSCCSIKDDRDHNTNLDFDREYFPNQFNLAEI